MKKDLSGKFGAYEKIKNFFDARTNKNHLYELRIIREVEESVWDSLHADNMKFDTFRILGQKISESFRTPIEVNFCMKHAIHIFDSS